MTKGNKKRAVEGTNPSLWNLSQPTLTLPYTLSSLLHHTGDATFLNAFTFSYHNNTFYLFLFPIHLIILSTLCVLCRIAGMGSIFARTWLFVIKCFKKSILLKNIVNLVYSYRILKNVKNLISFEEFNFFYTCFFNFTKTYSVDIINRTSKPACFQTNDSKILFHLPNPG